ncbi:unnamed protein product [Dibothriocephalus latus]|uniref:Uncharacterized protein n=1 Tax=Dibothriocephalus latus TaxID=60516 RepID=A0A3P7NW16_DIBLA|nr:unnamed protein product [Dibothriocephalus latus]
MPTRTLRTLVQRLTLPAISLAWSANVKSGSKQTPRSLGLRTSGKDAPLTMMAG